MATASGIDVVMRNLNAQIEGIKGRTADGLLKAGLLVQRRAQEKTPVDTGNLKASASTTPGGTAEKPEAVVSFYAPYAVYVHENLESHHPVGQARFLAAALEESHRDVLAIVAAEARVA